MQVRLYQTLDNLILKEVKWGVNRGLEHVLHFFLQIKINCLGTRNE